MAMLNNHREKKNTQLVTPPASTPGLVSRARPHHTHHMPRTTRSTEPGDLPPPRRRRPWRRSGLSGGGAAGSSDRLRAGMLELSWENDRQMLESVGTVPHLYILYVDIPWISPNNDEKREHERNQKSNHSRI